MYISPYDINREYNSENLPLLRFSLFNIISMIILGYCPQGYISKSGDVPGWGSISKNPSTATYDDCSTLCDEDCTCCSFEYSETSHVCNLNKECEPTVGPYLDYGFCSKGQNGRLNCKLETKKWVKLIP